MDINPQRVRTIEFGTARKGLDPDEVRNFLNQVANELERAQNEATAMEARARAAVTRLQQLSDEAEVSGDVATPVADNVDAAPTEPHQVASGSSEPITASVDESETISRTMLLAQRAADLTIAEAEAEALRLRTDADDAAAAVLEQARADARVAGDAERDVVQGEVSALMARRDFLESDVDQMERFLVDQRMRLREAAAAMIDIAERVPGGLGEVRRPLLSASDDESMDATMPYERPDADEQSESRPDADDEAVGVNEAAGGDDALDVADAVGDDEAVGAADADADDDDSVPTREPVMRLGFDQT